MLKDLIFFDKEGHSLNFPYNENKELFEGKLLFDENSTDTFKTIILNTFEIVKSFYYEDDFNLELEKFQLFNEKGITYKGETYKDQDILSISTVNNSTSFYSKWIEGKDFHNKFPVGTEIYFHDINISEFSNLLPNSDLKTFTVISNKNNAFMIISSTDNNSYNDVFVSGKVSSLNIIQIEDYNNLSNIWNQHNFYSKLYENRKISLVNSKNNEGIFTISKNFIDIKSRDIYSLNSSSLLNFNTTSYLNVRINQKTDRIFLYNGMLNFSSDTNMIEFLGGVPSTLSKNTDFIFEDGLLNSNIIYTVSDEILPIWKDNVTYNIDDLVKYNGEYYKAIILTNNIPSDLVEWEKYHLNWNDSINYKEGYPVKYKSTTYYSLSNSNINNKPDDNPLLWTPNRSYVIVDQTPINEVLVNSISYLTTTVLLYDQPFVENVKNTLITFYNKYHENFINFGIDLVYDKDLHKLDFINIHNEKTFDIEIYTSDNSYLKWNKFETYSTSDIITYRGKVYTSLISNNVGNFPLEISSNEWSVQSNKADYSVIDSYLINVEEKIIKDREYNKGYFKSNDNISKYYNKTLHFDSIDSFGLNLTINSLEYNIPFDTNISNTLNDWFLIHKDNLNEIGIIVSIINNNQILFETNYPNVIIDIKPNLGSLSKYYFKHSDLQITSTNIDFLNIIINDITYYTEFSINVDTTIQNWIDEHFIELKRLGIDVSNFIPDTIMFGVYEENLILEYYINTGINNINSEDSYIKTFYIDNNIGTILSSNSIINTNSSKNLQDYGFATAMIISISNSNKILNDQNYNILFLDPDRILLSYQGPFWDDNVNKLNIKTRDFIRQPRFGFDNDATSKLIFSWNDNINGEMFFYDFSGKQLHTNNILSYTGEKPLINEFSDFKLNLQKNPNIKLENTKNPNKQQTIFNDISFNMEKVDSLDDLTFEPEPFQLFIGYNDKQEKSINNTLNLHLIEDISLKISTDKNTPIDILTIDSKNWQIKINSLTINFIEEGFREGQIISLTGYDNTNSINQSRWKNNGLHFQIKKVFDKTIVLDKDKSLNVPIDEESIRVIKSSKSPFSDIQTGMDVFLKVEPKKLLNCELYAQSEGEDERYKTRLDNYGHNIGHKDVYIFREYDIKEQGVDWIYLNRKRKELLMNERDIFNHVTSYKSLINAIKFFGYNDLELYEYYRNINKEDSNFKKLHKIEIPNIFDNSDIRYNEIDPLFISLPNKNFEKTKLLNLTYRITDFDGNSVQTFSLDEVVTKLSGLKNWLQRKTLAVNTKILDITGRADVKHSMYIKHSNDIVIDLKSNDLLTAVKFDVEAYKQPISNGSNTYTINIKFKTQNGNIPDYFNLHIKTYKTYSYWNSTVNYNIGDKILYDGLIFESSIDNNIGKSPAINKNKWNKINLELIQSINEFKTDLLDYNFTMDKNIDAFAEIKVNVENGRGASLTFNKNISLDKNVNLSNNYFRNSGITQSFSSGYNNNAFF